MSQRNTQFNYRLYGLDICSDFEFPEVALRTFHSLSNRSANKVTIVSGSVQKELLGGQRVTNNWEITESACLIEIPGVARYLIEDGRRITVDLKEGADEGDMRTYLFGSMLGTLLHQRHYVPLHISSVATPTGVVAFTGDSGAGKSTIAGMLHKKTGWPLVSDDVAVLIPDDDEPILHSGILRLKLWKEAVALFGADSSTLTRDIFREDKFHVHLPELFSGNPAQLQSLIVLNQGDKVQLQELNGVEKFQALMGAIYRPYLIKMFNSEYEVFRKCTETANAIDIYSFERDWSKIGLRKSIDFIAHRFDG